MEALTAHVTPAVVNVNVTSKLSGQETRRRPGRRPAEPAEQEQQQMQQFFGVPFGQFFQGPDAATAAFN